MTDRRAACEQFIKELDKRFDTCSWDKGPKAELLQYLDAFALSQYRAGLRAAAELVRASKVIAPPTARETTHYELLNCALEFMAKEIEQLDAHRAEGEETT